MKAAEKRKAERELYKACWAAQREAAGDIPKLKRIFQSPEHQALRARAGLTPDYRLAPGFREDPE